MCDKPAYEDLERKIESLEKEVEDRKQVERVLQERGQS